MENKNNIPNTYIAIFSITQTIVPNYGTGSINLHIKSQTRKIKVIDIKKQNKDYLQNYRTIVLSFFKMCSKCNDSNYIFF